MSASWLLVLGWTVSLATQVVYEDALAVDHTAIRYWKAPPDDPVSRLAAEIHSGRRALEFHGEALSYLPSLLELLGVSPDSQTLVFSRTSLQRSEISPRTPRAIYFGDDVAVAFVPGGRQIELAALDPRQGVVFYTLDVRKMDVPRFDRPRLCLECHQGPATLGVPGVYVGSVYASPTGRPDFRLGSIVSDHRTAFEDRWGGWYVNGTHGALRHKGNAVQVDPSRPEVLQTEGTQNLTSLARKLDVSRYPLPVSDIVALMTLEHQTQMTNLLVRLGWESRIAEHGGIAASNSRIEELVRYMLFAEEVLPSEPIRGVSTFTQTFPERGPRDRKGRSLRDFDLERRLFRYPLSYMIYSAAFDALPPAVLDRVWKRLHEMLTGDAAIVSREDSQAILEILRDTKSGLPPDYD